MSAALKVLLAAGGTGGHLFPAEALANALIARGAEVELVSDDRASVYADSDLGCRIFEANDIERIAERDPLLKIILLENLSKDLANTLRRATQWIEALA